MQLRDYQADLVDRVFAAWGSVRNVLAVAPTGAGKTVIMSAIVKRDGGAVCVCAHRKELIGQISLALNLSEIRHRIIAPDETIREIVSYHVEEHGRSYYDGAALVAAASVDSIMTEKAKRQHGAFLARVGLWCIDEAHHVLKSNKWGKVAEMFPQARGLGVTATPCRADGKGLGVKASGVFEQLIQGPTMRQLIDRGFLCDYRKPDGRIAILCVPGVRREDFRDAVSKATGDFVLTKVREFIDTPQILGDVVSTYQRHAQGRRAIVFACDVAHSGHLAAAFRAAGITAEAVDANTPSSTRRDIIKQFRAGRTLVLINVDLFGEGFDVPACDYVAFARPTESYSLYSQQFGRGARNAKDKTHFIIADHVGNVIRHGGPPDVPRVWTLDGESGSRKTTGEIPQRVCVACFGPFDAFRRACPHCGHVEPPAERGSPERVSGDLEWLDPSVIAGLMAAAIDVNATDREHEADARERHIPQIGQNNYVRARQADQQSQRVLRDLIAYWAGLRPDLSIADAQRLFFITFGVDVLTAQSLERQKADALAVAVGEKIAEAFKC
jgi:DNA repair protein RadD